MWLIWWIATAIVTLIIRPWSLSRLMDKTFNARLGSTYDCQCGACENHNRG